MATPHNIEIFNETVGKTFAFLYEKFPCKVAIHVNELTGIEAPSLDKDSGERIRINGAIEVRAYSIEWLIDTGYISATREGLNEFHYAVLSAKGLEVLRYEPESLKVSFGDKLLDASKNSTSEVLKSTASSLLTAGATFAINHLLFKK